jgi:hypothetical protein
VAWELAHRPSVGLSGDIRPSGDFMSCNSPLNSSDIFYVLSMPVFAMDTCRKDGAMTRYSDDVSQFRVAACHRSIAENGFLYKATHGPIIHHKIQHDYPD